jgi:hypothetical protein
MILFVLQIAFRCRSVDDARADIDQDAFPLRLALAEGDDMSMIRTHPPRHKHVQLQLKSQIAENNSR